MTSPTDELPLAADFPAATHAQWQALALGVARKLGLAGDDTAAGEVDHLLATTTYDGIEVPPLHTRPARPAAVGAPGLAPFTRGASAAGPVVGGWDIRQRHDDPDPEATNAAVLDDLENGATSVWLRVGGSGMPAAGLAAALRGVYLDLAGVVLDAGAEFGPAADAWWHLVESSGVALDQVSGNLGADPIGWRARTGGRCGGGMGPTARDGGDSGPAAHEDSDGNAGDSGAGNGNGAGANLTADLALAARWAARCAAATPRVRAVTVDATVYHDAGGSDAQELGCAVATGVAYLRAFTDAGLDLADAFNQLEFRYAVNADQFLGIAKLRAARRLWARVAEACGLPEAGAQRQHAVTSAAMMTGRDPWVNLLRTTLAGFAASVGGAQAVTILPFDHRLGRPDRLARRMARNTQSLLLEEASLGRVVDPAGGSWYVESLTDALAERAWDWFTELERAGGITAALDAGLVAAQLDATWQRRAANLAHRRDPITGVSEFPNLGEQLPTRAPRPPEPSGGLPRHHYAEPFEELRARADGARVLLATIGPVAQHSARAGFAANLFAAGGIETVRASDNFSGRVACICGSDKAYAESVVDVVQALRAAGVRTIWLAGKPADIPGVDGYLYAGCDAAAVIRSVLHDLEVSQ
ncbi:heterodimeric methylmalonyl-CoA mutase small subunit [Asanoa ferruginea]|uniref:Heterodimeric methylmalonyl-CoA mutase small subunit n=1 Tax=Asanoa ferruginea TaxID=53367 RepID=A0A3D9ZQL1_9ACTN|nr:methylmalonyl-CoA mutase family protein [Asanoa ferruginea]REF99457.1 heterodimeric methylmalonyl-CoA mutase small subunit [Asanoa ferruginea]GIF49389.1 methylmalonyl-CoA mutase [Asanoa ferruginea]